jgi:hypothetical protein
MIALEGCMTRALLDKQAGCAKGVSGGRQACPVKNNLIMEIPRGYGNCAKMTRVLLKKQAGYVQTSDLEHQGTQDVE